MSRICVFLVALLGLALDLQAGESSTTQPTTQQLLDLAPHFTLRDDRHTSFRVRGVFRPGYFTFDVARSRPNHLSVLISDAFDWTPYVLYVDGRVIIFDAIGKRLIVGRPESLRFALDGAGNTLNIDYRINGGKENVVDIELKGLVDTGSNLSVTAAGDGQYVVTSVSARSTRTTAYVDTRQTSCPYTRIEKAPKGEGRPALWIRAEADTELDERLWRFPDETSLKRFAVTKFSDWWKGPQTDLTPIYSPGYRYALHDVMQLREKWEQRFGKTDWVRANGEDPLISVPLRQLVQGLRGSLGTTSQTQAGGK